MRFLCAIFAILFMFTGESDAARIVRVGNVRVVNGNLNFRRGQNVVFRQNLNFRRGQNVVFRQNLNYGYNQQNVVFRQNLNYGYNQQNVVIQPYQNLYAQPVQNIIVQRQYAQNLETCQTPVPLPVMPPADTGLPNVQNVVTGCSCGAGPQNVILQRRYH